MTNACFSIFANVTNENHSALIAPVGVCTPNCWSVRKYTPICLLLFVSSDRNCRYWVSTKKRKRGLSVTTTMFLEDKQVELQVKYKKLVEEFNSTITDVNYQD